MKEKLKEVALTDEYMTNFSSFVVKKNSNADIFRLLRELQDDTVKKQKIKITNLAELYWFLVDHRDKLK